MKSVRFVVPLMLLFGVMHAQTAQGRTPAHPGAAAPATKQQPKFKAIWEPVNYKQDLQLLDVFFVSKDEGWASGVAGTVLHTKDGGNTWTPQLGGDPHAQGDKLEHLFATDGSHVWAQSWNAMYRTTDGEAWQQVSGDIRGGAVFTSEARGFRTYGGFIWSTDDGGGNWKQVFPCRASMEQAGLTHEVECKLFVLDFPSPNTGYGVGDARITAKTEDGGNTWKVLVGPEEQGDQRSNDLSFIDDNTGFAVRATGLFKTTDGGNTWRGVVVRLASGYSRLKFAPDKRVGWSLLGSTWAYTTNGGKTWTTRELRLPAGVNAFALPAADRGYAVGDHGMIYRYRIVPLDYTSKGMIDAPAMGSDQAQ
jgi:photosystem II stability/assembly factor-like uncharacterized protein